jgi:putative transposase
LKGARTVLRGGGAGNSASLPDYSWRAVDQDGDVLDIMVQAKEIRKLTRSSFDKLLKGLRYVPRVIITDKLRSYSAAKAELLSSVEHCQQKYQNNRAENSHQSTSCVSV